MNAREWLADFDDFIKSTQSADKLLVFRSYLVREVKELLGDQFSGHTQDQKYESAKQESISLYGTRDKTRSEFRNEFRDRRQRANEPVKKFYADLYRLARKAFNFDSIDDEVRDRFLEGMLDRDLAILLRSSEYIYEPTQALIDKAIDRAFSHDPGKRRGISNQPSAAAAAYTVRHST